MQESTVRLSGSVFHIPRWVMVSLLVCSSVCVTGLGAQGQNAPAPLTRPDVLAGFSLDTIQDPALDQIPAFNPTLPASWGELAPGTVHTPRPRTYDLQHQAISVRFDWARHAVIGTTTLTLTALDTGTTAIAVDAVHMHIQRVSVAADTALPWTYNDTVLVIHFPAALPLHRAVPVTIAYETVRPEKGVYFIDRVHYLWTQGECTDTRYWVPTYDAPDDKTTWVITVTAATNEQVLSNGRLAHTHEVTGGRQWTWVQSRPASTYLMSVVVGRYTVIQDHWHDVPVDYWVYPDDVEAGRRGFAHTPDAVDFIARKLEVPYPWAKYDQSIAPDFSFGSMENLTATIHGDDMLLPAWKGTPAAAQSGVVHELAHQWFGNLATMQSWEHIWLNEGFATLMEEVYLEATTGKDAGALSRRSNQLAVIHADQDVRRPLVCDRWVDGPVELFQGDLYSKGEEVLQMLRHRVGEQLFWTAVHHYLTSHLYQNVVSRDLENAFEEVTHQNLQSFFAQWVYGTGFPVFQVSYQYDTTKQRLVVRAHEVQPRDSLTGYFDADVDIAVFTSHGIIRTVMPVRHGAGEIALPMDGAPRAIDWNTGKWLLEQHDFPRPVRMLLYQLVNDDDILGRREALGLLRNREPQVLIREVIAQAARSDRSPSMRMAALNELVRQNVDTSFQRTMVLAMRHDPSPDVRAELLSVFPHGATARELSEMFEQDSSWVVRGQALAAYLTVAGTQGIPLVERVLASPEWPHELSETALQVLAMMPDSAAQALYHKYSQ